MVEIVLEGPAKNALGSQMLEHLRERLRDAGGRPVLLTGAGDAFSAGLDLREIGSLDAAGMVRFLVLLNETIGALFRYPGPVVAAVNGHAIAGGAILVAACDHRVGTDRASARIGLNEVALGLRFPPLALEIVRHRVTRVEEVILGSALLDPAGALRVGLLDELAPDPVALARTRLAERAALPAAAYAASKVDLRRDVQQDAAAEARFAQEVVPMWTTDELRARIAAFLGRKG